MERTEQQFVIVYEKDGLYKAYGANDAKIYQPELLRFGWKHVATIEACGSIEYIKNFCNIIEK